METLPKLPSLFMAAQQKIDHMLSLDKITRQDIAHLSPSENEHLRDIINLQLADLQGEKRDHFLDKIAAIITPATKVELWEHNQFTISAAVADFMGRYGAMPTQNHLAKKTGLSRQTVAKHLKEYQTNINFKDAMEQFNLMNPQMLASVFQSGINGDTRAARLYFEMTGALNRKHTGTVVNGQTNYIQINNTILNQEKLQQLTPPAQLNQIEQIITKE